MLHNIFLLFVGLLSLEHVSFAEVPSSQIGNSKMCELCLLALQPDTTHIYAYSHALCVLSLPAVKM